MNSEMDKIQVYCECMEQVEASEELKERVLGKKMRRKKSGRMKIAYGMAAAAALFIISNVCTYAVYGSTWVGHLVNKSTIFFESDEEIQKARQENGQENQIVYGAGHELLGIYPENTTVEEATVDEIYDLSFSVGEEQKLISDDTWQEDGKNFRKFVKYFSDTIIRETYASEDAADLVSFLPQAAKWNLSWLGENYQPVEKGQIFYINKNTEGEQILSACLAGNYVLDEKQISLWFAYSCDSGSFEKSEYLNKNDFDYTENYTTEDGVDIAIMGKGNEAVGQFSTNGYYLNFRGINVSQKEMENIADHLDLATLVESQQ